MRNSLVLSLATALAVAPASGSAQARADSLTATIYGSVTGLFSGHRAPLPHAQIEARTANGRRTTMADASGSYRLERLPSGGVILRVAHAGHAPLDVEVLLVPGVSMRVDLELTARPVPLEPIAVEADARLDVPDPDARSVGGGQPQPEIELQSLDLTPGVGNPGLLDAVQSLPGNDPANATDVLYMRGSTADLKLVLLDGAPVYTPFHVAGLMRSFEPTVVGSASLHVGGAPARYDGGLTHILDLETRRPQRDRVRASGAFDLLSASTAVEGPLGERAGFLASARALHSLGSTPLRGERPYGYEDALLSVEVEPSAGHLLRGTGFSNREAVLLDFPSGPDDASWRNRALSTTYEGTFGAAKLTALAALSGYEASLPLRPSPTKENPDPEALLATASTDRVRAVVEAAWGPAAARTRVGASHDRIDAVYAARTFTGGPSVASRSATHSTGLFVDATRPLAPGVTLRAGLRADAFAAGGVRLAPRAALSWSFDTDAMVSVAAGRYHQATRAPDVEVERTLTEVVDTEVPAADLLPVASADHVVVSLDQLLGTRVRLGLQGFWKRYEGLESAPRETIRSSGIDLRLSSVGASSVFWLGYGMSWFWSTEDLSGYASDFAGRHLLSAGIAGDLAGPLRGEFRVAYGAGLPYTAIPFKAFSETDDASAPVGDFGEQLEGGDPPLVGGLDEEFLRLDLEIHARLTPRWGGRTWTVRPYLRVLNALDRRDALFFAFQPWRSPELTPLAERPVLPIVGVAFSF